MPGRLPVPLSKNGRLQAQRLKEYFSDKPIEKIYSSAVLRCKQTSEMIAEGRVPIEYDVRLLEILSAYQGYWEEKWELFFCQIETFGGETNLDAQKRVVDFFTKTNFIPGKEYILCSHADPLYFLYLHLAKKPLLPQDCLDPPDDYPSMGSVRTIRVLHNGRFDIEPLLSQKQLADEQT